MAAANAANDRGPDSVAAAVLRHRVWQSVSILEADSELIPYIEQTFVEIAHCYNKKLADFAISDVKRAVDAIHAVLTNLALANVTLTQFQSLAHTAKTAGDVLHLISFSVAVAGLVKGQLGWLVWHVSKSLAAPRVKRASAVYVAGHIAATLYGGEVKEIRLTPAGLDPVLDSMDRQTLCLIARHLRIGGIETQSEPELLQAISKRLSKEGKEQSLGRAWFPRDAESYVEVLVVVAKVVDVDIKGLATVDEIEGAICSSLFKNIWDRLTPEQRVELSARLQSESKGIAGEYVASTAALGAIGAAQLSGFGVYMAASTALSFLSTGAGIALPFSVYTGLSVTIATVIGPFGAAIGVFPAVFEFLRAKPERLLGAIAVIATWRSRLIAEGRMLGGERRPDGHSRKRLSRRWTVALVGALAAVLVSIGALLLTR